MSVRPWPSSARVRAAVLALLCQLAGSACAPGDPSAAISSLSFPVAAAPNFVPPSQTWPASLRAAYLQARQQEAGTEYLVQPRGAAVAADNALHHLAVTLDSGGVQLRHTEALGQGSLRLVRAGCAEAPVDLTAVAPRGYGTRVEYVRPGLTEWYVNGPMGIEQGFTFAADTGCKSLVVELQLSGDLLAQLVGQGDLARIELQDRASGQRIYYSDLFARDAQGQELGTRLALVAQTIRLEVATEGAHYPIEVDPMLWSEQQRLMPSDGAAGDTFGYAVAVSGDTAVIGAAQKRVGANTQQGQAYVYVRAGTTWTEQQKLIASDGAASDRFGIAVAISGDTIIVGAAQKQIAAKMMQGQAYVYARAGTTWTEQQKLVASDGAAQDGFGVAVAISGNTAVVGASQKTVAAKMKQGQAYVYARTGTTWTEQQILIAANGAAADLFGAAVAISGDTTIVSAPDKTVGGNASQGQAYVYVRTGTVWTEQQKLIAADGAAPDRFGNSITISGDTVVIGALNKKVGNNLNQGQVYVYVRTGTVWTEQQKIIASDGLNNDNFGVAVAISGDLVIVGANAKSVNGQATQGQAYVYVRTGTTWAEQQKLTASDGVVLDQFGISVAISGETAIVSASQKGVGGRALQGQAYAFLRVLYPNGDPCTLQNECASGFCVANICCDSACTTGVCTTGVCRLFADLRLTATGTATRSIEPTAFNIQLDNVGPNPAQNIRVMIDLPPNAPLISVAGEGWTCTPQGAQVSCTLLAAAVGPQAPIVLLVQAPYDESTITVAAVVTSENPDPAPGNNSTTVTVNNENPVTARFLGGGLGGCSAGAVSQSAAPAAMTLFTLSLLVLIRRRRTA